MKKTILILMLALAGAGRLAAQEPLTAAVLDFQTSGEKLDKKGAQTAILLNALLSASPNLILVERQELEKIFGEQELGLSGTVNTDTAAKVGSLTGAKVLITGRLFDVGDKYFLVAKIMSTETSRVYGETATFGDINALDKAVGELSQKVQVVIEKQGANLVAKVETPEERLARLKKFVEGKKLPSVSVKVTEEHLTRALIDPAVETEFRLILQQLGFTVLDPADTTQEPDVRITGEAFSEFGARRGNLVSAIARVEIKAVRKDGSLLGVDRQRGVAVDLAENVAAKEALQNAALKLLDRLVPKLADNK
jgi:hypothetical protein